MKTLLPLLCCLALVTSALAGGKHTKGQRPLVISQGEQVSLADFLVPGSITVFVFTSEYAPLCRNYAEPLLLLHQRRTKVAVVKVDINRAVVHKVDWDSPVVQQYGVKSVPHFKVYGPDGALLADDTNEDRPARTLVDKWLSRLE